MRDAEADGCVDYGEIKSRLLRATGSTIREAEKQLFSQDKPAFNGMTPVQRWRAGKRLFLRILGNECSMKGVVQLVTGWIKQFVADKDVHMLHCSNPV